MLCNFCGREVPDHSVFCLTCGKEIDRTDLSEVSITHESTQPMTPNINNEATSAELGKKPEKFNIRNKAIKIVAAALAIILGVSIGIASLNRKPKPTETEITETTNSETQETEVSWWELDWTKQDPELQRLNNLSVEEFRNEPLKNQLSYYSFINDIFYDYYYDLSGPESFYVALKTASLDDTAQEIIDQEKNKLLLAASAVDESANFDKDEARKLLSATVYDIISTTDAISTSTEATGITKYDKDFANVPDGAKYSHVIDYDGLTQTGENRSEVTYDEDGIPCVSLTMTQPGKYDVHLEYKLITFTNYPKGEEESIWLNTSAKLIK